MSRTSRRALARYAADQLQAGISASKLAGRLASIMIESGLTNQADFLVNDIAWELERRGQLTTANVITARPLGHGLQANLETALKKLVKVESVLVDEKVDSNVLGGIRIETPGRVWDSTIARKLRDLRETF